MKRNFFLNLAGGGDVVVHGPVGQEGFDFSHARVFRGFIF